ncbi:MAG: 50S ribosomal protein L17 [Candidatus Nealsonbacteria bacterium CG_4_10_14_0_8_um_filter_37_14]|uniref:Large ribosomal subunit protein bL17 n=1 Tax=Candidatus Nealsonbacteria bacterium CG_4_10_14_0_8_um_filter_37_14 TaxID=1974684 RepID=A0A2M7R7N4_9BACT|nr:MAG: 50S ribosomal protein L17 [Candidatus Nealsonbacteria bacterium CG_4_10_14_0_8_um_filter_37_14]
MRKRKKGRKLHREKNQRRALLKSLVQNFIMKEKIQTTEAKAKEIQSLIEKSITSAKRKNLTARRQLSKNFHKNLVKKLMEEIAPRYEKTKGGYTRIIKLGRRKTDGAKMAIIELVK